MILIPFNFASSGAARPINIVAPSIQLVGVNECGYTPGVWDDSVTSVSFEWFVNSLPTGIQTPTFVASLGASVYVNETATNPSGSRSQSSNVISFPQLITPPSVIQNGIDIVIYDTPGVWDDSVTSVVPYWAVNNEITSTPAVIGVPFDATTIGAKNQDIVTVIELPDGDTNIQGSGNALSYLSSNVTASDVAAINYELNGAILDSLTEPLVESAAINYEMTGVVLDSCLTDPLMESAAINYEISGSIT